MKEEKMSPDKTKLLGSRKPVEVTAVDPGLRYSLCPQEIASIVLYTKN